MGVSYSTGPTPDSSPGASIAVKSPMLSSTKRGSELLSEMGTKIFLYLAFWWRPGEGTKTAWSY